MGSELFHEEWLKVKEKYDGEISVTKEYCQRAMDFVLSRVDGNMKAFQNAFPSSASIHGKYGVVTKNTDWTNSFWTGILWLAYEATGSEKYRNAAESYLDSFQERIEKRICTDNHDLGFLYSLSCISAYKLTGNERAKKTALEAADQLMVRYVEKAGIIQAWGDLSDPSQSGRMIIDCTLNLPLLYWAAEETGDRKYYDAAYSHVKQSMKYLVREDASTYHTYFMDVATGKPRFGSTHQGYSDHSCWARGQAWAIYGFMLSYIYTGDELLVDETKKVANYFLNRLPPDHVCYWDLIFTDGNEERDSSAAAIAACGLLEAVRHLPLTDETKKVYENAALHIIKSLADRYTTADQDSNGILAHGVYSKPRQDGVDECNIWGDYFYFEALVRLIKDWKPYW